LKFKNVFDTLRYGTFDVEKLALHYAHFWYLYHFYPCLGYLQWPRTDKFGSGTNFIRAVPKIERSINGAGFVSVTMPKAPFTLRSIFGTARIKLVPVPLFWVLGLPI
jgi:hypothetical protein